MTDDNISRRKVISLLGGAGTAAIAGCGGSDDVSVPDPEQDQNQGNDPQQQETQEEPEDELQEAPFEDRLEPSYAEQHEEAMQDVNQYTVNMVSKEGFAGPFFDGTIRVNEDTEEVFAQFDIAPEGVDFDRPNVSLQVYRNGDEVLARTDDGELEYAQGEPDITNGKVTDFDTVSQLMLPNAMMRPGDSVQGLLENVPVYLDSDRSSPEHNNVDGESFVYNVDVVDLVQGDFGEWLKDRPRAGFNAEVSLDKEEGYVSSFAVTFDRQREDNGALPEHRYKASVSESGSYSELEPDWAPVARDI
jgi:hypothetical protein